MIDRKRTKTQGTNPSFTVPSRLNEDMLADLTAAIALDRATLHNCEEELTDSNRVASRNLKRANATLLGKIAFDLGRKSFSLKYLEEQVFSKYVTLSKEGAHARRQAAIDKWHLMELRNFKSNHRILALPATICGMDTEKILDRASFFVQTVIGSEPPADILFGAFSGGASTSQRRGPGAVAAKFEAKADVTDAMWLEFSKVIEESATWKAVGWGGTVNPRKVPGNVLFTVPKNSSIDRVAAKEPDLNMFAQKGIGNFIRNRLLSQGVDLNDQTVNQRLAEEGSRSNLFATIDLSSASDTVCTSLVCRLLAPSWFVLLDRARSPKTDIDSVQHELSMFSSMGNGFTFELESLIFWALMKSVAYLKGIKGRINVYGDDIIIPVPMFPMMTRLFSYFGFILNTDKSFGSGPFRESCGKHYYKGYDVTPFFVRRPIDHMSRIIHVLNNLTSWLERNTDGPLDEIYADAGFNVPAVNFPHLNQFWLKYSRHVERRFRGGGRDYLSSINVLVSSDSPKSLLKQGIKEVRVKDDGAYLYWLRIRDDSPAPQVVREDAPVKEAVTAAPILNGATIWKRVGFTTSFTLSEALVTSSEVITLESVWIVRPYRDVVLSEDPRK